MLTKEKIIEIASQNEKLTTRDLVKRFKVSRQYANSFIAALVADARLIKLGSTRKAFYILPQYAKKYTAILRPQYRKIFKNISLEEHKIFENIIEEFPKLKELPENVKSTFVYAISEMLNNAIEHSSSASVEVEVFIKNEILTFVVNDSGVGIFRNIKQKKHLKSELEAIQDLMKGKTTTMPKSHSGEGIFFTSKAGDFFKLDSFGYELIMNNEISDVFVKKTKPIKRGTTVMFEIKTTSHRNLTELFNQYANLTEENNYGFDKTQIQIKLYTMGSMYLSRSQARRVLSGLERFKVILFDFDKVTMVGQAFADEIFRVFHHQYPHIRLEEANMVEEVKFMVDRAKNMAKNDRSML